MVPSRLRIFPASSFYAEQQRVCFCLLVEFGCLLGRDLAGRHVVLADFCSFYFVSPGTLGTLVDKCSLQFAKRNVAEKLEMRPEKMLPGYMENAEKMTKMKNSQSSSI